jgi:hypothetical protein
VAICVGEIGVKTKHRETKIKNRMIELPDDVIRCVISEVSLEDMFMIEKTCRELHDHVSTVASLRPSQKRSTYENRSHLTFTEVRILKWFHDNGRDDVTSMITAEAMDDASGNGHIDVVKWLHMNRTEGCSTGAMDYASWEGHLEIVVWLHENRSEGCTTKAIDVASWLGRLEVVKWLTLNRTEGCTSVAMDCASKYRQFQMVKWLHENRTEGCTTKAMDVASRNGDLEIVKWLHENRVAPQAFLI